MELFNVENRVSEILLQYEHTIKELEAMSTLCVGQADSLKVDLGHIRVWLSRCTVADGEPYDNKVTIEQLVDGVWTDVLTYQAV